MVRALLCSVVLSLPAFAGEAKLTSFKVTSADKTSSDAVRKALEAEVLPRLLRCAIDVARGDTLEISFDVVARGDAGLWRDRGLYFSGLEERCESAALGFFPADLGPTELAFTVKLKTTAAERTGARPAHLRELTRFCARVAELRPTQGADATVAVVQAMQADKSLSGRTLAMFRLLEQTSPGDHLAIVEDSAKSAGGTVKCSALK